MLQMDEPGKHYIKWKRPDTKDYILHDSIYMKCPDKQIHATESRLMVGKTLREQRKIKSDS
jgi:hypothetical protein